MVLFAGPIFTGYWVAIFFAIVFGPVLLIVAFVVDRLVGRRLAAAPRWALAVGVVAGGTLLIVGGFTLRQDVRFNREARAVARSIDFTTYEPEPLPPPFTAAYASAEDDWGGPALVSRYAIAPGIYAHGFQQKPGRLVSLQRTHCRVEGLAGPGSKAWDSPCRLLHSPHGISVYIAAPVSAASGSHAFALINDTLVRLQFDQVADQDVLAYFDSLRPVDTDDLEFER